MKKILYLGLFCAFASLFSSCHRVTPGVGEEAVLIDKPWFFGHEGVRSAPVPTGSKWVWFTTEDVIVNITRETRLMEFDDMMSNNNTPLNYSSYLSLCVVPGKSPILIDNYGIEWYKNNIEPVFRNYLREEISKYSAFDLMNRDVCGMVDSAVFAKMTSHIADLSATKEFPVICYEVRSGRVKPHDKQFEEMNNTAAAIQAKQTQEREVEMQMAREKAEKQRALADKAYMETLHLTPSQFIQLRSWEIIKEMGEKGKNVNVLVSPSGVNPVWNVNDK